MLEYLPHYSDLYDLQESAEQVIPNDINNEVRRKWTNSSYQNIYYV
jgi:ABC-type metal ion transport system substrate-binding protein